MSAVLDELYGLLVPLSGSRLVLPRAAVVEVLGYAPPRERPEGAPEWLLGWTQWQGNRIPLISFEAACGQPLPEFKNRTRIAVVQAIGGLLEPPAFAIATQGYPYLLRVNRNVLKLEQSEEGEPPTVLSRVRMANERPAIPDLEEVERMLAAALGIEAKAPVSEAVEVIPDEPTHIGLATGLGLATNLGATAPAASEEALRFDDEQGMSDDALAAALDAVADEAVAAGPVEDLPEPSFEEPADAPTDGEPVGGADAAVDDLSIEGLEVDEGDGS
jgi:chemosensory pili system protein ChpC